MSFTIHYDARKLSIEKCLDIFKGKNPAVIRKRDRLFLSWDDRPRHGNARYGVWFSTRINKPPASSIVSIDKGYGTVWNGQGELQDYLSKNGIDLLWWD